MKLRHALSLLFWLLPAQASQPELAKEFIFTEAPFAQCHASTIAESDGVLVAAWFGGTREKSANTAIWLSRREASGWATPREIAQGMSADSVRQPVWNPVLFQPRSGPLLLFYKVGPDPARWWGMWMASTDGGRSWSAPQRLPEGIIGPSKNKPIQLPDDTILSPSSSENGRWKLFIERNSDRAQSWTKTGPIADNTFDAIQPALLRWPTGKIQLLARSRQKRIVQSGSLDGGRSWSALTATELPNPNSGIDALVLRDGRAVLVYNTSRWRRSPLRVAISSDGQHWQDVLTLDAGWGEYSYPAVIQGADGMVHITYTWKRERIRHVVLDPASLSSGS